MTEEIINTDGPAPQGWAEGGAPVESMSTDDAETEIKSIESSPDFLGNGKLTYWPRQNMLKRRATLYRHSLGEEGDKPYNYMAEVLGKQGITEDTLEEMQEGFADRDEKDTRRKTMETLTSHFGTKEEAETALGEAKGILKRFAKEDDLAFLDETGLGNDPELIGKLAEIGKIFQRANEEVRKKNEK